MEPEQRTQQSIYKDLLKAVLTGQLQEVAETIYRITGSPIAITNQEGTLLAQVPKQDLRHQLQKLSGVWEEKPMWNQLLHTNSILPTVMKDFLKYLNNNIGPGENVVVVRDTELSPIPVVLGRYWNGTTVAGQFGMVCTEETLDTTREAAEILSQILSSIWASQVGLAPTKGSVQKYLEAAVTQTANLPVPDLPPDFQLVFVEVPMFLGEGDIVLYKTIAKYIDNTREHVYPLLLEDGILLLFTNMKTSCENTYVADLVKGLKDFQLKCAVGSLFSHLGDVYSEFRKVQFTLELGLSQHFSDNIFYAEEFTPQQMLWPLRRLGVDPYDWIHPVFRTLRKYDLEYKTEYMDTWKTYLLCNCDRKRTIQEMNIHYNTLVYRLDRIEDIVGTKDVPAHEFTWMLLSACLLELG